MERNKNPKISTLNKRQSTAIYNNWLRKAQYAEGATRQFGRTTKKKYNLQERGNKNEEEHGHDTYADKVAKSFDAMDTLPKHPTKAGLKVKQSMQIQPNFDNWNCKYTLLALEDGDPAIKTWREDMVYLLISSFQTNSTV
jgi:hypothetical protein